MAAPLPLADRQPNPCQLQFNQGGVQHQGGAANGISGSSLTLQGPPTKPSQATTDRPLGASHPHLHFQCDAVEPVSSPQHLARGRPVRRHTHAPPLASHANATISPGDVETRLIRTMAEKRRWHALVEAHHCLPYSPLFDKSPACTGSPTLLVTCYRRCSKPCFTDRPG